MHSAVPAVAKTLLFTALVPGSVAGIVPWLISKDSAPAATGAEFGAAAVVIALGVAIYIYTAFWSFAAIGGGTPAPIAPTKILVVQGLHRYVRNPMYIGVGLVVGGQAWLFHSSSARGLSRVLLGGCPLVRPLLRGTDAAKAVRGRIRALLRIGAALDSEIQLTTKASKAHEGNRQGSPLRVLCG